MMDNILLNAIKTTLNNIKKSAPLIKIKNKKNGEMLTIRVQLEEIFPNNLKGEYYAISATANAESIERLRDLIQELKDPNHPIITKMICEIFKEHGEEMLFGRHKAKITVTITNSQHLVITEYTKILLDGYKFIEEDEYEEKEI